MWASHKKNVFCCVLRDFVSGLGYVVVGTVSTISSLTKCDGV